MSRDSKGMYEGFTPAHAHTHLTHTTADNASLPAPRDQGESASHVDKEGHESKYHENHKSRAARIQEKKTHEEREALREQFAKEDEVSRKEPAPKPESREWKRGTETPREHR